MFLIFIIQLNNRENRVENVRERLRECKILLLLKCQDIRKLWLLISEQNALIKIYQNIDELKHVPIRSQFYLNKNLYIHASLLLIKAKEHQKLLLINALSDIDVQLKDERITLEKENRLLRKQLDPKYILVDIRQQAPHFYLDVLLQSLPILSHSNETLDYLQKQFRRIVLRTTQHIIENNFVLHSNNWQQNFVNEVLNENKRNINAVHDILQRIIEDIASNIQLHPTKRILDRKLTEFIRDRFIGRVIKDIFKCLPPYADDFCQASIDLLFKHRESCYKLFLSILERNDSPETSIYSNESVKDQDINRHILTMPVFYAFIRMAKQQNTSNNDKQEDNADNIRFRQMTELKHY
ncbi:unnamed protein product [Rotaria magnacalcarata]|uniref:Uncharacterized protein n=1 Tax=Rotaria magnacalcarata TaxID=392030 RepID=A0A816XVR3_9BILA|nr:unnamed protein product [Rotaria magnacalcarata]